MATINLPRGLADMAEDAFIKFAQEVFKHVRDYQYNDDPDQTKIWIASDQSSEEIERFPQIRVQIGTLSDYRAHFDHMREWEVNTTQFALVDQAYCRYAIYAVNAVECRNMADFLRVKLLTSKPDFGIKGIFNFNPLSQSTPQPVRQGGAEHGAFMTTVDVAFMTYRRVSESDDVNPLWDTIGFSFADAIGAARLTINYTDFGHGSEPLDTPPVITDVWTRMPRDIMINFDQSISPHIPLGFSLLINGSESPSMATRSLWNEIHIRSEVDIDIRDKVRVVYDSATGDLTGPAGLDGEDALSVESFNRIIQ